MKIILLTLLLAQAATASPRYRLDVEMGIDGAVPENTTVELDAGASAEFESPRKCAGVASAW